MRFGQEILQDLLGKDYKNFVMKWRLYAILIYNIFCMCYTVAKTSLFHSRATETIFQSLIKLSNQNTPVFSHQGFWNIFSLKDNPFWKDSCGVIVPRNIFDLDLETKRHYRDVGEAPYVYGLSIESVLSNGWQSGEDYAKKRATLIAIVKLAWKKYHAIPIITWGLESPYVPHSYKSKFGRTYRYDRELTYPFPVEHKDVMNEIMSRVFVPDNEPRYDSLGYWLPNSSSRCGIGRYNADDEEGYDSPSEWFDAKCKEVAYIINAFVDNDGIHIPVIFRLWHECEAGHFWWGGGSKKIYKDFYVYTVKKFRQLCPHKNILFGYCKDRYWSTERQYLDRYPGDEFVDVIGFDNYTFGCSKESNEHALLQMRIVSKYAQEHNKVAALFETGNKLEIQKKQYLLSDIIINCIKSEGVRLGIVQIWSSFRLRGDIPVEDYRRFLKCDKIITTKNDIDLLNYK